MDKKNFIDRVLQVLSQLHQCEARHVSTTHVQHLLKGQLIWEGDVESFAIEGHRKATWCYCWTDTQTNDFVTQLGVAPVTSPHTAVKTWLARRAKPPRRRSPRSATP